MNEKTEKRRKRAVRAHRVIGTLGIALLLAGAYSSTFHVATGTRIPIAKEGRVYELDSHGTVVYLTRAEWYRSQAFLIAGIAFIGAAMWIHVKFVDRN